MAIEHDGTFTINDIVLTISPEQINIQNEASHKEWKPVRIRAPIKAKSGHSVLSIHISVPFVGVEDINKKLRPLIAQFRLTPFCYVDNEHLRNNILGFGSGSKTAEQNKKARAKNMALALQNLTVSTIPNEPCSLQADFYFLWFNYLPFTPDFTFKDDPITGKVNGRPGKLWEVFYASELRKLDRVKLTDSSMNLLTTEYLIANPEQSEELIENKTNLNEVVNFAGALEDFNTILEETSVFDGEDGQLDYSGPLGFLVPAAQRFQDIQDAGYFNRTELNNIVDEVDKAIRAVKNKKAIQPSITDKKLKQILTAKENLLLKSAAGIGLWFEFPDSLLAGKNKLSAVNNKQILDFKGQESKLYYRGLKLNTDQDLILEQVSISLSHNLAIIPMAAHQYPTIQYMGGMDIKMNSRLKALSDDALGHFTTFWNVHHNSILNAKQFPRQYHNVYCNNELLRMFGVNQVILESKNVDTIPGSPGTFDIAFGLCEAGIKPGEIEGLKAIPAGRHTARKVLWQQIFNATTSYPLVANRSVAKEKAEQIFITEMLNLDLEYKHNRGVMGTDSGKEKGIKGYIDDIYDSMVKSSGQTKSFTGSLSKKGILNHFNEILAISNDEVYGIKGIQKALWERIKSNSFELFGNNKAVRSVAKGELESYKLRPEVRSFALPDQPAITMSQDTSKKVLEDMNTINLAISLLQRNVKIQDWKLTDPTTKKTIDLKEGLKQTSYQELVRLTAEDIAGIGIKNINVSDDAAFQVVNNEDNAKKLPGSVLNALKILSSKIRQVNSGENPYSTTAEVVDRFFKPWNEFSLRNAEYIIDSPYIQFDLFSNVNKIIQLSETDSFGRAYRDFPLPEIRDELLKEFPELISEDDYVLEPDMYFYNHTADNGIGNLINENDIIALREATETFTNNVYDQNTTWFQKEYIGRMKGGFDNFLGKNKDSTDPFLRNSNANTAWPATKHLIHPRLNFSPSALHSVNNNAAQGVEGEFKKAISSERTMLSKRGATVSLDPNSPISVQIDAAGIALGTSSAPETGGSLERNEASDVWVMPLQGDVVITSVPGYRPSKGRFHQGTDIATRGGKGASWNVPVVAAQGGTVVRVVDHEDGDGGGIRIAIQSDYKNDKLIHYYMHLNSINGIMIPNKTRVKQGEVIGFCGNTGMKAEGRKGSHLHFEVRVAGDDSLRVYPFGSHQWDKIQKQMEKAESTAGYRNIWFLELISMGNNNVHSAITGPNVSFNYSAKGTIEHSIDHMRKDAINNTGLRMNRAYPGILFSLIEEDAGDVIFRHDDFFNYSSIVSMDVVRDREVAADLCVLELTNISGILSNRKWEGTWLEDKAVFDGREQRENPDSIKTDTDEENPLDSLMLREGIKVELRLGYSDNAKNLEPVLVGRIVGVQFSESDDLVRIEIQSLATELVQDLKGLNGDEKNGLFYSDGNTAPLLADMMSSHEVVSFGFWKRNNRVTNTNRDLLTDRWEWNPKPAADNLFSPDSVKFDPGSWTKLRDLLSSDLTAATVGLVAASGGPVASVAAIASTKALSSLAEGVLKKISGLTYFLYQTTIWDVFKEMELRHPEYIASPVPYYEQNVSNPRMTMFFGLPDFLYFARDPSSNENAKVSLVAERLREAGSRASESNIATLKEQIAARSVKEELRILALKTLGFKKIKEGSQSKIKEKERASTEKYIESYRQTEAIANGSIQPFRKYHLLTGKHHIVSNNIRARSSNTFNAVTVRYTDGNDSKVDITDEGLKITDTEDFTIKLDPSIPDEFIRENLTVFPNCYGETLAKNYATSLLSKGVWQIYSGELVILGNPSIKPYDICYIFDEYSDMYGPVQVRRVQHIMSNETGFLTVITPDCVNTISEGVSATTNQAMALASEVLLKRFYGVAVGGDAGDWQFVETGTDPNSGVQVTPLGHLIGVSAGKFINFFGGKRYLFRQQTDYPIRVQPLIHHGRPMVAGFGPGHVMKNEFSVFDSGTWKPAITGFVEQTEQWANAFKGGILSPRGKWGHGVYVEHDTKKQGGSR